MSGRSMALILIALHMGPASLIEQVERMYRQVFPTRCGRPALTIWTVSILTVGLAMSLVHAPHLIETTGSHEVTGQASLIHQQPDVHETRTSTIGYSARFHTESISCPAPQWSAQPISPLEQPTHIGLYTPLDMTSDMQTFAAVPTFGLPVARGPDRQSVLQQFRL